MTSFTNKSFSVAVGTEAYRENWERTFREAEGPSSPWPRPPSPLEHAAMEATRSPKVVAFEALAQQVVEAHRALTAAMDGMTREELEEVAPLIERLAEVLDS